MYNHSNLCQKLFLEKWPCLQLAKKIGHTEAVKTEAKKAVSLTHTHTCLTAFFWDYPGDRYQKDKINLDFTEARDSEWQWHQLGHMQVSTSLQIDNHANTSPLSFLQTGCPSCRPTNSVKALKAQRQPVSQYNIIQLCTECCEYISGWLL